jgi:MoxR-like ATPase
MKEGTKVYIRDDSDYLSQGIDDFGNKAIGTIIIVYPIPVDYKYQVRWSHNSSTNTYRKIDVEEVIEITEEEVDNILTEVKQFKQQPLITNKMKKEAQSTIGDKFVFMNKTQSILEVGHSSCKNVVLYGPGGHGKSEITLEFLAEKGIDPYVITMGTGMTTDRLFGGIDFPVLDTTGRIEYLVENSFMNHEYVIFEEMFDAPDFILEQLKDILSSGKFRNGTQVFNIKTKFIVCCTNRTREEFSKNMSLKALMERFPLELNVVWDNYNEMAYNKLLETKFGEGNVDPIIPFLLQEYAKNGITISPRIAVTAYQVFDQCGPESLTFIAEFAKKPELIASAIKTYESTLKFREMAGEVSELIEKLESNAMSTIAEQKTFKEDLKSLESKVVTIKSLTVNDDIAHMLASLTKAVSEKIKAFDKKQQVASIVVEL